ncbi:MAG: hypothetical protein RBR08_12055 [Desulforegulaceae bacterium]|nr:hypothetical protein [Desulforegulaceae bacterium]
MKKLSIVFFLFFALCITAQAGQNVCGHITMEWLNEQAPIPAPNKIILKKEQFGLCEIIISINGEFVPVYAGQNFILAGQMFSNRKQITDITLQSVSDIQAEERQNAEARRLFLAEQQLEYIKEHRAVLDEMTAFTVGDGGQVVYLITDPLCPHCKSALSGAMDIVKKYPGKATFQVIVTSIFQASKPYAEEVICYGWNAEKYLAQSKDIPQTLGCQKSEKVFKKTEEFFPNFGLSGVPAFIAPDAGWKVEGANMSRVQELLKLQ